MDFLGGGGGIGRFKQGSDIFCCVIIHGRGIPGKKQEKRFDIFRKLVGDGGGGERVWAGKRVRASGTSILILLSTFPGTPSLIGWLSFENKEGPLALAGVV